MHIHELPHHERVAVFEFFQTAKQGWALRGRALKAVILENCFASGLLQGGELQGRVSVSDSTAILNDLRARRSGEVQAGL